VPCFAGCCSVVQILTYWSRFRSSRAHLLRRGSKSTPQLWRSLLRS